jgi:CheY-like chemotaxis protein
MRRRILLADDSVTIQKVIELTFLDEDYEVKAVSNGDEALARLSEVKPDFVIADVHMPGANGYEVCRRSKQLRPDVPVLLLVGTFEPFDEGQARTSGADSFLKKPFDSQELLQRVEDLLGAQAPSAPAPSPATAFEASPGLPELDLPPLGGFDEPAPSPAPVPEFAAEPAWGNFELEAEPAAPAAPTFAPPAEEPFDREPSFDLGPEPAYAPAVEEPVFALDDQESTFTLQEEIGAPEDLSLDEAPQDRYLAEPEPELERPSAGFAWQPSSAPAPAAAPEPAAPAAPAATAAIAAPSNGSGRLSDEDVDRIARRVVEMLGDKTVRDVAWEVIPDMAEVIIRDRLRELEAQVE